MGAFAMALWEGRFLGDYGTLAEGTVHWYILNVVSSFRENGQINPTKDDNMELGWNLHKLFWAFNFTKDLKVVPLPVISELWKHQYTEPERVLAQLIVTAFFFACCSCKYRKVQQDQKWCKDILKLHNIRFFKDEKQSRYMHSHQIFLEKWRKVWHSNSWY